METFALQGNLGDVLRCSSAQATAAQLLGTGLGVLMGPWVGSDLYLLLGTNLLFSGVALWFAYLSSSQVQMASLNVQRAELIFREAIFNIREFQKASMCNDSQKDSFSRFILTPDEIRSMEVFVKPYRSVFPGAPLRVNPPLGGARMAVLTELDGSNKTQHVIGVELRGRSSDSKAESTSRQKLSFLQSPFEVRQHRAFHNGWPVASVALWLQQDATGEDVAGAYFHACLLRELLAGGGQILCDKANSSGQIEIDMLAELYTLSESLYQEWWPQLVEPMQEQGWSLKTQFLDVKGRRISVDDNHKE